MFQNQAGISQILAASGQYQYIDLLYIVARLQGFMCCNFCEDCERVVYQEYSLYCDGNFIISTKKT